jgi:hypothetical protein
MNTPPTTPTARDRYEATQDHVWKARGLARPMLGMVCGHEKDAHIDDRIHTMFLEPSDLRTSMEVLIAELLQAEKLLGSLELNIAEEPSCSRNEVGA